MQYRRHITAADMKKPLNLSSKLYANHKYAYYKYLREHDPVHKGKLITAVNGYFLTHYDDCVAMLKDRRFVRNRTTATGGRRSPIPIPKSVEFMMKNMINEDEPEHRRLRGLVHKAFTPRALASLSGRIETVAHQLLDEAEKDTPINLMERYARPIPVTVIAEMVGVEMSDMPRFYALMRTMSDGMNGIKMAKTMVIDMPKAIQFVRELVQRKRSNPADDIMTSLIEAEEAGDRLSEDELIAMVFLLVVAGYETTYNLITNAVYTLQQYPDQLAILRDDMTLLDSAVEEFLRFNGPLHATKPAYVLEPVTIKGVTIPKGATVMPLLGSCNHDPAIFDQPAVFDITRQKNPHLGFGQGIHYCLGAPLARIETSIALRVLIERHPHLRLAVDPSEIKIVPRPGWHQYKELPIILG